MSASDLNMKKQPNLFKRIESWLFLQLRLSNSRTIKVYDGFGNKTHFFINGHALSLSPIGRKRYRNNLLLNMLSLVRMFMVRPIKNAKIELEWDGKIYETHTEKDGFYKFEWPNETDLPPGNYTAHVFLLHPVSGNRIDTAEACVTVPFTNQFTMISDIDDTFLISHSSKIFKKLYVLFTKNALSRKPFEGVVAHYQMLQHAATDADNPNPFFYVSSSEWNLYKYIQDFSKKYHLPKGTYLLNQIKTISQLFNTGGNNHQGKFTRIVRIMEAFPTQKYILLGDDSQQDPYIYASLVKYFEEKIYCIYIRSVSKQKKPEVEKVLQELEKHNVQVCYFKHSSDAKAHSEKIGLVNIAAEEI